MKGIESPFGLLTDEEDIRIYERQQEEDRYMLKDSVKTYIAKED